MCINLFKAYSEATVERMMDVGTGQICYVYRTRLLTDQHLKWSHQWLGL
jgi:hypothetical protein